MALTMGSPARSWKFQDRSTAARTANTPEVGRRTASRPTRVAVVTPYYPPHLGGVERYAQRVVQALEESPDHEPVLITSSSSRSTSLSVERGMPVVRLGTWLRVSNTPVNPAWFWQVRRWLRLLEVDVVNAHAPVPFLADVASYAGGPRPVVLTYHAGTLAKGKRWLDVPLRLYEKAVLPKVFRRCAGLIAVSPASYNHRFGATLIPGGVDLKKFTPAQQYATRRLLFVGRVERTSRWKGLQVLLEAMPRILAEAPQTRLSVVGEGDDLPHMRAEAQRLGIDAHVDWHGGLHGRALVDAYQSASMLVLPSLTAAENSPLVLLEAKATGIPVVGSRVGGIPHMVREGIDGLLSPPGDPEALAAACVRLLLDPGRARQMGREARASAEVSWSWPCQTSKVLAELDQALSSARLEQRKWRAVRRH